MLRSSVAHGIILVLFKVCRVTVWSNLQVKQWFMSPGPGRDLHVCRVKNTFRDGPAPLPEHGPDRGGRDAAKIPGRAGPIASTDGQAGSATSPAPVPPTVPFWVASGRPGSSRVLIRSRISVWLSVLGVLSVLRAC
jgi:hypothetical protein